MCGEDQVECPLKSSTGDDNRCDGDPSTCDEVNSYYDENDGKEVKCKKNTFDEFIAKRKRQAVTTNAAGTGALMGES